MFYEILMLLNHAVISVIKWGKYQIACRKSGEVRSKQTLVKNQSVACNVI
jgi:hypothetical protein